MFTQTVEAFIDLVLKYAEWKNVKHLSKEEFGIFRTILVACRLHVDTFKYGIFNDWDDFPGDPECSGYRNVNNQCPFHVIYKTLPNNQSTSWLECLFCMVLDFKTKKTDRELLVANITREIEGRTPFIPIQVTREEDMLIDLDGERCHRRVHDSDRLDQSIMIHAYCGGSFVRISATAQKDALSCQKCHLRVLFPKEIQTFGELRVQLGEWENSST